MAVKYYYDGKKIIMAPSPNEKVGELIELCTKHAQEYKAPNTWTLIHGDSFPSSPELTRQNLANNQQSSGDGGIGTFFMIIFVIVFWAAVIIGGGYLLIEILGWLFSGSGSGGDGTTQPFRLPFRRRR